MPQVSLIIPSTRKQSLAVTLESISNQTYKNYETIVVLEKGPLAHIRNMGAERAKGDILCFIDDDVYCHPEWLHSIVEAFRDQWNVGGVSGPCPIPSSHRKNRDIFKYQLVKSFYDRVFLEGKQNLPGRISPWGAWTTGACNDDCDYSGTVDFLEACNMSFFAHAFHESGGFDEKFGGVGEWSEPDLCYKIKNDGWRLVFTPGAKLFHFPSQNGVYKERLKTKSRLENYELFWDRWCERGWKLETYKRFVKIYYRWKNK